MNIKTLVLTFGLALAGMAATLNAQQQKTAIYVHCENNPEDSVGTRFCTDFRDRIAISPRYRISATEENAIRIGLVTLPDSAGVGTAISSVATIQKSGDFLVLLVGQYVQTCGSQRTYECAGSLLSSLDQDVQKLFQK